MAALLPATAGASASPGGTSATAPSPTPAAKAATAIATWFGPGFFGRETACGQLLTPHTVGVASRNLPCGTLVKVVYKGRSLTVPVLDRGPYGRSGARWDLTAAAATDLGITETVRIRTSVVGSTPNVPTLGEPQVSPEEAAAGGIAAAPEEA